MRRLNSLPTLPLGVRLSLIVILSILVLAMAIFLVFNHNINHLTENTNRQRLNDISVQVQRELQENIEEVANAGQLTSQAPAVVEVTKGDNRFQAQLVGSGLAQNLNLQDTALTNKDGEFIVLGDQDNNVQKLALIEASQQGKDQLEIIRFGAENWLYIAFAYPIYDNSEYIGSVFGARRIDTEFFSSLSAHSELKYVLLYENEPILATFPSLKEAEQFIQENVDESDLASLAEGKTLLDQDLKQDDQGVVFGIAYLPLQSKPDAETKAVIVVRHKFRSIAEFQRATVRNSILIVTALTLIILVLIIFYTRQLFVVPLIRLEKQAELVIEGDYTQRIIIPRTNEFGRVAELINQLTETVQHRENELNDLTHILESQVEETVLDLAQAYEQLQYRETYLENIFTKTNDAILILDASNHHVLDANNKAYELAHYTRRELLGMPFEALHAEDKSVVLQAFWEKLTTEKSARTDQIQWQTKDFPAIDVEISASLVDLNEEQRIIVLAHNITESKRTGQQIQKQNEELRQANQELAVARQKALELADLKSQFLATMSHELRTPLNAIIGYTEIQLAGMTGELNQEQLDYQKRILENSEHLLNMINDLLDLTKIDSGRVEIRHNPVVIKDLMTSIRSQMSGLAKDKHLDFEMNLNESLPAVIIGDAQRIKQILINLLSNAIKFTEEGSVKLEIAPRDEYNWQMIVTDTGIGIPPHAQEYIFDEFRQLDSSSRRQFAGTGLGLAIVKKLVLLMNGKIKLDSTIGGGSKFTIILPLLQADNAP